jgi:hypothetical protein
MSFEKEYNICVIVVTVVHEFLLFSIRGNWRATFDMNNKSLVTIGGTNSRWWFSDRAEGNGAKRRFYQQAAVTTTEGRYYDHD